VETYKKAWEQSYVNADNFMFYPDYNVIWFVAKFIKRRFGHDEFKYIRDGFNTVLDLGCGIGSNLMFLHEYGFDAYGLDLSETALEFAKSRFSSPRSENMFGGGGQKASYQGCFKLALTSCPLKMENLIL
jgi:2-polyprenyl-3-methyl-5-hydroxy-6-metoxy-1,4-benzoquinol methylase